MGLGRGERKAVFFEAPTHAPSNAEARKNCRDTMVVVWVLGISVREANRRNSVFETELRLTFSPIFRNDAMALVGSQGTILSTMASISSQNVAV